MVLGKFRYDSPLSYEQIAENKGAFYFSSPDWDEIQAKYHLSNKEMFRMFNKPALKHTVKHKKALSLQTIH